MSKGEAVDHDIIVQQVRDAIVEDLGDGDLTAALVPAGSPAKARVLAREAAVLCGQSWFDEVYRQIDSKVHVVWSAMDGDELRAGQTVCEINGDARALLSAERTALNFLQTLSGTATVAARYVAAVSGTGATILDTRKTIPGLRLAQKYAVRCGGASNHRVGLYDAILIKENHIRTAGSIAAAMHAASANANDGILIEIEVESLSELEQALAAGAKRVLLDNFGTPQLKEAVCLAAGRAALEASGGVDLDSVREIAESGVDFISVGELTKHLRATDFSMLFVGD